MAGVGGKGVEYGDGGVTLFLTLIFQELRLDLRGMLHKERRRPITVGVLSYHLVRNVGASDFLGGVVLVIY